MVFAAGGRLRTLTVYFQLMFISLRKQIESFSSVEEQHQYLIERNVKYLIVNIKVMLIRSLCISFCCIFSFGV